jgi:hypothetical protein
MHAENASEEIRIEIPPGSYKAVFATRNTNESIDLHRGTGLIIEPPASSANQQVDQLREPRDDQTSVDGTPTVELGHTSPIGRRRIDGRFKPVAIASIGLAMGIVGFFVGHYSKAHTFTHQNVPGLRESPSPSDDPVASFWAPFLREDPSPIIAYADAMFLIDGAGDLFRFRHGASDSRGALVDAHLAHKFASNPSLVANAGPLFYDNGYTGTGDLRAMAMLITQLAHMGATPIVESSYDISTDDLKHHNVILLGSSAENLAVAQLVPTGDFLFEGPVSSRDPWSGQMVNSQARSGEQSKYATVIDPVTHVLQEDYALISFQPGAASDHQIAILGGIDTTGTEGAAWLVTSKSGVEELMKALSQDGAATQSGKIRSFQALVSVDVKKGYQVLGARLIAIHRLN